MICFDINNKEIKVGDRVKRVRGRTLIKGNIYTVESIISLKTIIISEDRGVERHKGWSGSFFELVNRRNNLKDNDPLGLLDIT